MIKEIFLVENKKKFIELWCRNEFKVKEDIDIPEEMIVSSTPLLEQEIESFGNSSNIRYGGFTIRIKPPTRRKHTVTLFILIKRFPPYFSVVVTAWVNMLDITNKTKEDIFIASVNLWKNCYPNTELAKEADKVLRQEHKNG